MDYSKLHEIIGYSSFISKKGSKGYHVYGSFAASNVEGSACEDFIVMEDNINGEIEIGCHYIAQLNISGFCSDLYIMD